MSLPTLGVIALCLATSAGLIARWAGGPAAGMPAVAGGAVAALTQLAAAVLARRALDARFPQFLTAWAVGVGLRFGAFALFAVATLAAPAHFPPLPSAFGFVGVLVPLLLLEIRLTR